MGDNNNINNSNNNIIKNNFPQQWNYVAGENIFLHGNEANVDDLAKACA